MSIKLAIAPHGLLRQTRYALGHPGYPMLPADSQQALEGDYAMFRDIERSFFAMATGHIDLVRQHAQLEPREDSS